MVVKLATVPSRLKYSAKFILTDSPTATVKVTEGADGTRPVALPPPWTVCVAGTDVPGTVTVPGKEALTPAGKEELGLTF